LISHANQTIRFTWLGSNVKIKAPREAPSIGDIAVIALSPVFVACLVGSLVFFLLDVFYQGENEGGIRWMMFWYVVAIVAVARISVDRGLIIANVYGLALAVTTWLYISIHPSGFHAGDSSARIHLVVRSPIGHRLLKM
jgi:hypothetical protein